MTLKPLALSAILFLILCLLVPLCPAVYPVAAINEARWMTVNTPDGGAEGRWVLASGSDIRHLTDAPDGTLYCYANLPASLFTLFKSTDGGLGWFPTGQVTEAITDIAVLPQDAASIYLATASCIYKSTDAGSTFAPLIPLPAGAGSDNIRITSIDVTRTNSGCIIAAGTIDTDFAQYGGIYLFDESQGIWTDTNIGAYDVYCAAFSPDYNHDCQIIALISDEAETIISRRKGDEDWGQTTGNVSLPGIVPKSGVIAFPDNYSGTADNAQFFAGIDTGINNGDVYRITCTPVSSIADLNIGAVDSAGSVDVASVVISGSTILAGCARDACIYLSNDNGNGWLRCAKPPTGQSETCVVISPYFAAEHKAYAVTCGTESAFSVSVDNGVSWNQTSLIDTKISTITDLAVPSPSSIFLITHNAENLKHSLWRTSDGGNRWERIFCGSVTGINSLNRVKTAFQYNSFSPIILIAGLKNGNPTIWKSEDNGQTFSSLTAPCTVDAWEILDAGNWFIGGYDGMNGLVYRTCNGGNSYDAAAPAGSQPLSAIALSPNYLTDKTILAGNSTGQVYISEDSGASFSPVGQQLPLISGKGNVNLAFDRQFNTNRVIYAATDARATSTSNERLFHYTLRQSIVWESICSPIPENAILKQVIIADDGALYTINTQAVFTAENKGGVLRSLNPEYPAPAFETILNGLEETVTLSKLEECDHRLWVIDSKNARLMTFFDSSASQVPLYSPGCFSQALDPSKIKLEWQVLPGAAEYEWQVSKDIGFSSLPTGSKGTTATNSARPANLSNGTEYYWRVRAVKPLLSYWSDIWVFTTSLAGVPELILPRAGEETSQRPTFQWSKITGAGTYDLQVAKDTLFQDAVIDKKGDNALPVNVWQSDVELENDTTYYWKVRARSADSYSSWSAVSTFFTVTSATTKAETTTETAVVIPTETLVEEPFALLPSTTITLLPKATQTITLTELITVKDSVPAWVAYVGFGLLGALVILLVVLIITIIHHKRL
jgi:photosystem II stability/assembly factor-like uncharacterized protein